MRLRSLLTLFSFYTNYILSFNFYIWYHLSLSVTLYEENRRFSDRILTWRCEVDHSTIGKFYKGKYLFTINQNGLFGLGKQSKHSLDKNFLVRIWTKSFPLCFSLYPGSGHHERPRYSSLNKEEVPFFRSILLGWIYVCYLRVTS